MASFDFIVDTSPLAQEIKSVSHGVNRVSGAVVAMQTAVIAAEEEGAEKVCRNVNQGFYTLMQSQISQKIVQLSSTVEAKLMELGQYAAALKSIQARMSVDYNMISGRYAKLFKTINNNLEARIAELDQPVFKLVDRDIRLAESRQKLNSAHFSIHQSESILSSQLLTTAKVKTDAQNTLNAITQYVKGNNLQSKKSDATLQDTQIESVEDIYIPVSIVESTSALGQPVVNYYVARSENKDIDKDIDASVREHSIKSVLHGSWIKGAEEEMAKIETEFNQLLMQSNEDKRIKDIIQQMFNQTQNIQQLKSETNEL